MSSVRFPTLQLGQVCSGVWRPTLQPTYLGLMTNDGNPQPLAVIVGERLKLFREERDLRQADIAAAATACGLAWSRSSVAALESGTRNLSVEELVLLPFVVSNAGGWDQPLIPPDTNIRVAKRTQMTAEHVSTWISYLFKPIDALESSRTVPPEEEESVRWAVPPVDGFASDLDKERAYSQVSMWRLSFSRLHPSLAFDQAIEDSRAEYELLTKITDRLEAGWEDLPVPWYVAAAYGRAMWGWSPGQERDWRAGDASGYASKRSLQSSRGHITRDLIREIQERIDHDKPVLDRDFDRLRNIWDQVDELKQYALDSYVEADENRKNFARQLPKRADLSNDTIGQALKKARTEMGIGLSVVSEATHVRLTILIAIEDDDFSLSGGDVYARGHIRAFARYVGLEPGPLLEEYDKEHGGTSTPGPHGPLFHADNGKPPPPARRKLRRKKPED